MIYTVKQLADIAGVSARTLHYYDQIGLLLPAEHGDNGYRYYNAASALRLQQIRFFRELDLSLTEIQAILDAPDFDLLHALQGHRQALTQKVQRLSSLIHTIDQTILHLKGATTMATSDFFAGFDEEHYTEQAAQQFDERTVRESQRRWQRYTPDERTQIKAEGLAIYSELAAAVDQPPTAPSVQALIARWHQHLRHFYEPTADILYGLGNAYADDPAFRSFYEQLHPELPELLRKAITVYCEQLTAREPR